MANPKQVNATEIEITREVPGAWVTFGPGAAVMKVVIQKELLAVKIRRLPPKSTPEFVSELLSRFDIHIPANRVKTAPDDAHRYTHEMSSFAVVHTDNPELPEIIHGKLHADDRPDIKDIDLSKLIVFAWNPRGPREPGGFRIISAAERLLSIGQGLCETFNSGSARDPLPWTVPSGSMKATTKSWEKKCLWDPPTSAFLLSRR